jgi:hypothetical protein
MGLRLFFCIGLVNSIWHKSFKVLIQIPFPRFISNMKNALWSVFFVVYIDMETLYNYIQLNAKLLHVTYRNEQSTEPSFVLWWWKLDILFELFHRRFSFTGGQRCILFLMGHSLHIMGRVGGRSRDSVSMSMVVQALSWSGLAIGILWPQLAETRPSKCGTQLEGDQCMG